MRFLAIDEGDWQILAALLGLSGFFFLCSRDTRWSPLFQLFLLYHWQRRLSDKEQELHAHYTLMYCFEFLGETGTNRPKLSFSELRPNNFAAVFKVETCEIVIYRSRNRQNASLVNSVIHEFQHWQMFQTKNKSWEYNRINQHFDYASHPWETLARTLANKFQRDAHGYILYQLGYCSRFVRFKW